MFIQECKCKVSRVAIPISNQTSKAEENNQISEKQKRSPRRKMVYSWRQWSRASRKVKLIMLSRRVKETPREFGHEPSSSAYEKRKKWSGKGKKKPNTWECEGSDEVVWKEILCLFPAPTLTKEICFLPLLCWRLNERAARWEFVVSLRWTHRTLHKTILAYYYFSNTKIKR